MMQEETLPEGWRCEEVAGHPVYCFEPAVCHAQRFAVLYLHGVHGRLLHQEPDFVQPFAERGLRLICPVAGPYWWIDRPVPEFDDRRTPEQFVVESVLPWAVEGKMIDPARLALLGTSMGGQGVLRLSYKHPRRFPVVAAISPAIDFHCRWREGDPILQSIYPTEEAARQETALLYAQGLNCTQHQFFCCDPDDTRWWESVDRLRMKLASMGCRFECDLETRAGGHGFEYYSAMAPRAAEFIEQRLEQHRRTLV